MLPSRIAPASWSTFRTKCLYTLALLLVAAPALFANTPGLLRVLSEPSCHCNCAAAAAHAGCARICDSRKHVTRTRMNSCMKPHMQTPAHNSNAGPRFPHPGRAEHAELRQ